MKKFKLFALTALLCGVSTSSFAAGWTTVVSNHGVGNIIYKLEQDGDKKQATVMGVVGTITDAAAATLTIPATITVSDTYAGTYPVVAIDNGWESLSSGKNVTALTKTLNIDITNFNAALAKGAYDDFTKLEALTIADTSTGDAVKTTEFPGGLNAATKTTLKTVTLSNNITTIPESAFAAYSALTTINLAKVKTYGNYAFSGATKLTAIDLTAAETIGAEAFAWLAEVQTLTIPATVKSVGADAFKEMAKLKTLSINISNDNLKEVGAWFSNDAAIESITIESAKLTKIAANAFKDAAKLTTIDLSKATALNTVEANAFADNEYTSIKLAGTKLTDISNIIAPAATMKSKNSLKEVTLPAHDGFTAIADNQFNSYKVLESIIIPEKVTSIGTGAFNGCEKLATVTINGAIASLGGYAFTGCKELASLDLSKGTFTALAGNSFQGCVKLATLKLPEGLTTVLASDFEGIIVSEINLPNVTTFTSPFGTRDASTAANTTLKTLTLGAAVIDGFCLSNFTALETVNIKQVQTAGKDIADNAFYGCTSLRTFNYDATNGTKGKIADKAFAACSNSPLIIVNTSDAYISTNTKAPLNSKYGDGALYTVKTVLDKGGSGKYYGKVCPALDITIEATSDLKVYAVYVDEGTAYFRAYRTSDGLYKIAAGDHAIIKTNAETTVDIQYLTATPLTKNADDDVFDVKQDVKVSVFQGAPGTYANGRVASVYDFTNGNYIYRLTNNAASGGFGFTYFTGDTMKTEQFFIESKTAPAAGGRLNTVWLDEDGNVEGDATAIQTVKNVENEGAIYNLAGQKVDANFKGVVIKNGKKMIQK